MMLTEKKMNVLTCRVLKNDSRIYWDTSNNRHDVTIDYQGKTETFTVYTGKGWDMISGEHALRLLQEHIEDVSGAPDLDYWLVQCSGKDLLHSVVEELDAQEARAFQQAYFDYCHDLETRFLALVGEEWYETWLYSR